jgi:hypothetical protein
LALLAIMIPANDDEHPCEAHGARVIARANQKRNAGEPDQRLTQARLQDLTRGKVEARQRDVLAVPSHCA